MLTSKRGVSAVEAMPREYILPESDGTFGQVAGRPALPWEAWTVAPNLVNIWQDSQAEVEAQLLENLRRLVVENHACLIVSVHRREAICPLLTSGNQKPYFSFLNLKAASPPSMTRLIASRISGTSIAPSPAILPSDWSPALR
jgi:hypothetical protein